MKKIIILLSILIILSACNAGQATSTPTPTEAAPAPTATATPAENGDGDDPFEHLIEYVPGDINPEDIEIVQILESVRLTNTYFEVSYVMPATWFFWHLDENNLNADPAVTETLHNMTIDTDPLTNESFIDLFELGNNYDESANDHLSVGARAIFMDGMSMDDYFEMFKALNTRSGNTSVVFDGAMTINEVEYRRLVLFIEHPTDSYDNRIVDTFSIERNGYVIMVRFDGWASCPENEQELMTFMMFFVQVH